MAEYKNGGDFLRVVMEEMCRKQGVERWAETTPDHLLHIEAIKRTILEALIIRVIRDGREVALSWEKRSQIARLPWDRTRPAMAASLYWEWIVERGCQAGRQIPSDYIEVHYEDLVRNPETVLKRLEPFIEHDLNYQHIRQAGVGSVSKPNTAFQDDGRSPIGRWQRLDVTDLDTLESLTGPTLTKLGYLLASTAPRSHELARLRSAYRMYFDVKLHVKTRTWKGKWLVTGTCRGCSARRACSIENLQDT